MAIFKKSEPPPPKGRDRTPASRTPAARSGSGDVVISIIGPAMRVVGDITTDGTVRIEGQVEGTIEAARAVILAQEGVVKGDIRTQDAVIGGTVEGSIVASSRLELQSTAVVHGEITTRANCLKLEEGARFAGRIQMDEEGGAGSDSRASVARAQPEAAPSASLKASEIGAGAAGADD